MPAREFSEHPGNFADKSCASEGVSFRPFPSPFPCPFVFPVFANERSEGCQSHKDWHAKWRQGVRGAHSHVAKHGTLRVLACTAVSAKALQARVASKAMPNGTCHWLGTHAARRGSWRRVSSGSGGCGAGCTGCFFGSSVHLPFSFTFSFPSSSARCASYPGPRLANHLRSETPRSSSQHLASCFGAATTNCSGAQ